MLSRFATLIGIDRKPKQSILECVLDITLDFLELIKEYPWVLKADQELHTQIQLTVCDWFHGLFMQISKEAKTQPV